MLCYVQCFHIFKVMIRMLTNKTRMIQFRNAVTDFSASVNDNITITKVIVGTESTRLEMTPLSVTKVRNAMQKYKEHVNGTENTIVTNEQIIIDGTIFIVLETKRDMGLFASKENNYVIVQGVYPSLEKGHYQLYGEKRW